MPASSRDESLYERLLDAAPVPIAVHRDGELLYLNSAAVELLGISDPDLLLGTPVVDLVHEDERALVLERQRRVMRDGEEVGPHVFRFVRPDGETRHVETRGGPVTFEGAPAVQVVIRDVTETWRAVRRLEESESRFRAVAENAQDAIVTIDADSTIVYANPAVERMFGHDAGALAGSSLLRLIPERLRDRHLASLRAHVETGRRHIPWDGVQLPALRRDGTEVQVEISFGRYEIDGTPFFTGIIRDLSERERARRRLEETESRYRRLFEESYDAVYVTHRDGRILDMNPAGVELFGFSREELLGLNAEDLYEDPADRRRFQRVVRETGGAEAFEVRLRTRDGTVLDCLISATARRDETGAVVGYQGIIRDVTERKRLEERLREQALHDPLTRLANRALFWDRLMHAVARAERTGDPIAVFFVDLDRFKSVNDSLGHAAGDEVLVEVARRLTATVREIDTVARVGGDEFTVLLEDGAGPDEVERVAERLERALGAPFRVQGEELHLTASIGIATHPASRGADESDGRPADELGERPADELVRRADAAMYLAKDRAGTGHRIYEPGVDEGRADRVQRENELRRAIEEEEFRIVYQPIVNLATGRVGALEALARWRHPERGLLSPEAFLPLAEETGLIHAIGDRVLERAFAAVAGWNADLRAGRPLSLHVNVSATQFEDPGFAERLGEILDRTGVDPAWVELEVTEYAVVHGPERARELRRLGVGIAVDDFGTGYSSLGYVKQLLADALKIDRSLVAGLGQDRRDEAIVRAVVALGNALDLRIVAEGVETRAQLEMVRRLGCGWAQGFHLARPLAPRDLERLLAEDPTW